MWRSTDPTTMNRHIHLPRRRSAAVDASPSRGLRTPLGIAALLAVAAYAAPSTGIAVQPRASAAPRPACDRLGRTVLANTRARVYATSLGLRGCAAELVPPTRS